MGEASGGGDQEREETVRGDERDREREHEWIRSLVPMEKNLATDERV